MSLLLVNPTQPAAPPDEWARLIPGVAPGARAGARRLPRSLRQLVSERTLEVPQVIAGPAPDSVIPLLIPSPLQSRKALKWLRSMVADWVLVGLSWLLLGGIVVPLRALFPHLPLFNCFAGAPLSLMGMAVFHAAFITLIGHTEGLYSIGNDIREQARVIGKSVGLATMVLCAGNWLQDAPKVRSALCCAAALLQFSVLWTWRRRGSGKEDLDWRNVLIVGAGQAGRRVADYIEQHPEGGRKVCGLLDDERPLGNGVIGRVAELARITRMEFADEVILAAPHNGELARQVLSEAQRLRLDVEIVPELFGSRPVAGEVENVGGLPMICVHAERLPSAQLALKRFVDVLGAGLAMVMISPLLAAIALLIKLDSPGPVFYCAQRAGRKGRLFSCCKFRTMVRNADELKLHLRWNNERAGPFFKIAGDPRITRLGHILRRYSLDELPQLWNVVKGEMSLVGPRPHPLDDISGYEIEHLARLDVTPGITGLWQVTARRDPSFQRGMQLDREYIRKWSLGLDLRILLRTVLAVARGSGE